MVAERSDDYGGKGVPGGEGGGGVPDYPDSKV